MRVLVLSDTPFLPQAAGNRARIASMIAWLTGAGHEVGALLLPAVDRAEWDVDGFITRATALNRGINSNTAGFARQMAEAATGALRTLLGEGDVRIFNIGPDKYSGRVVADAATRRTANVSTAMLAAGHARSYGGGHRNGWCANASPFAK